VLLIFKQPQELFEVLDPEYESTPISLNVGSVYATTHRNIPGDVDG
jgi:hypothetical protein